MVKFRVVENRWKHGSGTKFGVYPVAGTKFGVYPVAGAGAVAKFGIHHGAGAGAGAKFGYHPGAGAGATKKVPQAISGYTLFFSLHMGTLCFV